MLDPFAGGSVRGVVAAKTGREYVGVDLSERQVKANREQAEKICNDIIPAWHNGDSVNIDKIAPGEYDLVFSCPPYYDLEVYSDLENDLSAMEWDGFIICYRQIISAAVSMLKDNRFACFVVGDIRDKKGIYRNFVSETIQAFQSAGAMLYNEAILVTAVGSLPIRAGRAFKAGRKLGKTHQNVLVFVKGDAKKAAQSCGDVVINEDMFKDNPEVVT